jgi:biopolymer transport protein TolQ
MIVLPGSATIASFGATVPFLAALGPGELAGLVSGSTFFGKFLLLVLLFLSVMSWAVFIEKARTLNRVRGGHRLFWGQCERWLGGETGRNDLEAWCHDHSDLPLSSLILETSDQQEVPGIRRASERVTYLETENLERYLILLSTTVTISPFLGLLGTVWGIMSSFWGMASMQSANLTVVAPGIAEALITTIAGLAAAIPAVIFYNMLVRKIDLVGNELDRLRTVLEEEAGGGSGAAGPAGRDMVRLPEKHQRESI